MTQKGYGKEVKNVYVQKVSSKRQGPKYGIIEKRLVITWGDDSHTTPVKSIVKPKKTTKNKKRSIRSIRSIRKIKIKEEKAQKKFVKNENVSEFFNFTKKEATFDKTIFLTKTNSKNIKRHKKHKK